MNSWKKNLLDMLTDMQNERKSKEESDRQLFNRKRYLSRDNVHKSNMRVYTDNNNNFNDIKTQQRKIADLINHNRTSAL